jgi:hypothetical protein
MAFVPFRGRFLPKLGPCLRARPFLFVPPEFLRLQRRRAWRKHLRQVHLVYFETKSHLSCRRNCDRVCPAIRTFGLSKQMPQPDFVEINAEADLGAANPRIQRFWRYTQACRRDGGLPSRAHFDPMDIPDLLPNIWIVEADFDKAILRYRLAGTKIVAGMGFEPTGLFLHEVLAARLKENPQLLDRYWLGAHTGICTWRRGPARFWAKMDYFEVENLIVPFAVADSHLRHLMAISVHYRGDGAEF